MEAKEVTSSKVSKLLQAGNKNSKFLEHHLNLYIDKKSHWTVGGDSLIKVGTDVRRAQNLGRSKFLK